VGRARHYVSAGGRWGHRPAEGAACEKASRVRLHLDANVVRVHGVCVAGCPSELSGPERSWIFWKDFGG